MSTPHTYRQDRPLMGIGLTLLAVGLFVLLDASVKQVGLFLPVLVVLWARFAFQLLAMLLWQYPKQGAGLWRTRNPRFQLTRGLMLTLTSFFGYFSLQYIPLAEFTAIISFTPLLTTALSIAVLKERVARSKWLFLGMGFAGALLIVRPGGAVFGWAALLPVAAVLSFATFHTLTRRLTLDETPYTTHFYVGLVGTAVSTVALLLATALGQPIWAQTAAVFASPHALTVLGLLLVIGAFATLGHWCVLISFYFAKTATLTPFMFAQLLFATLAGWLLFAQLPDGWSFLGMGLIVVAGVANVLWDEWRQR